MKNTEPPTAYLRVKNWERFQHYKRRNPPWIRLYNELLDDYAFSRLQDASKWHAVGIWLLASRFDNRIPDDPHWIAQRINARSALNMPELLSAGFIERYQDASVMLASCEQNSIPEAETETEENTTSLRSVAVVEVLKKPAEGNGKGAVELGGPGGMAANELVGMWMDRMPTKPEPADVRKQGGAAKRICEHHSREHVLLALDGIEKIAPHCLGEPFDLFDLERKFSKAVSAGSQTPATKAVARAQRLRGALG